jgi:hypothetical protein
MTKGLEDPEIQKIVNDPGMQRVPKDIHDNTQHQADYLADLRVRSGFEKLREAGILHF